MSDETPQTDVEHPPRLLRFGPFAFRTADRVLTRDSEVVAVPPRALAVLEHLLQRSGQVVSKDELMATCWEDAVVTEHSVNEAITILRHTLGDDSREPTYIETVHRRGYRFIAPVEVEPVDEETRVASYEKELVRRWASLPGNRRATLLAIAFTVAVAALGGYALHGALAPAGSALSTAPASRVSLLLPQETPLAASPFFPTFALSKDGTRLVYVADLEDNVDHETSQALYLRNLDSFEISPLPGTEEASAPFFSPDGRAVAFFTSSYLGVLHLAGGPVHVVAKSARGSGGSWSDDDRIVFSPGPATGLSRVAASGTPDQAPESLTEPDTDAGEVAHVWPDVLPGGDIVFTIWTGTGLQDAKIAVLDVDRGAIRTIVEGGSHPRYLSTGHLLFARNGAVQAVAFDPDSLQVRGPATPILRGIPVTPLGGAASYAASDAGTIAYLHGTSPFPDTELVAIGDDGSSRDLLDAPGKYYELALSPDGRRIALTALTRSSFNIWLGDRERRTVSRLTHGTRDGSPVWRPDGRTLTCARARAGHFEIVDVPSDRSAAPATLWKSDAAVRAEDWTPDGKALAITEFRPSSRGDLSLLVPAGEGTLRPLVHTRYFEAGARFSPDGRWIAYHSDETGEFEVYVRAYSGPDEPLGGRVQISTSGGGSPMWSPDGDEIFYRSGHAIHRVTLEVDETTLRPSIPRVAAEGNYVKGSRSYAPDPLAGGFVVLKVQPLPPTRELRLLQGVDSLLPGAGR